MQVPTEDKLPDPSSAIKVKEIVCEYDVVVDKPDADLISEVIVIPEEHTELPVPDLG